MTAGLLPWPRAKFFAPSTNYPLSGGKVFSYQAGTTTPLGTFSDSAGTIPNTNPVILDANGEASIYLGLGSYYKINVQDASGVQLPGYPVDNVYSADTAVDTAVNNLAAILANNTDITKGSTRIGFADFAAPAYLKTQSDINNGLQVSISRFLTSAQILGVRARTNTDDLTPRINAALNSGLRELFFFEGTYNLAEAGAGLGYCMLNQGCSMIGEGLGSTKFYPLPSVANTVDLLKITPTGGGFLDFLRIQNLLIDPKAGGGTARGKRAIYMAFDTASNLAQLYMAHNYCLPGNDLSLHMSNNPGLNAQGIPSNSTIERNAFWEGARATYIGDSVHWFKNIFRSTVGSARIGLELYITDVSGIAALNIIEGNNFDCDGGAIKLLNGRLVKMIRNNIEQSNGAGSNGAVVDIDGSSGSVIFPTFIDNHIGVLGTSTVTMAIRANATEGLEIDRNTILAAFAVAKGINITASSNDTILGFNEIQSNYTTPITNSGGKTMGATIALTPQNAFVNSVGYQAASCFKAKNGEVTVVGVMDCPGSPASKVIATLGLGYRPLAAQRFAIGAVVGGAVAPQAMEIATNGDITYFGSNTATRIEFNATFPTLSYIVGSA